MKRKILTLTIALICLTALFLIGTSAFAADTQMPGSPAPGGEVSNVEQLLAALGGEKNANIGKDGYTVYLSDDILLNAPVHIVSGNYRIIGRGCTVYRGFSSGAMFQLTAANIADKEGNPITLPTLTFGASIPLDEQDLDNPDLILDGNSSAFTKPVDGPIIALLGKATLTVNPSTLITNNSSSAPGGAFYLESFHIGSEFSPLAPTLYCNGGRISNNISNIDGGAIAAFCNVNGNGSGEIQLNGCELTGNKVENSLGNGRGGAVFSEGCRTLLNACEITSNSADLGGAVYTSYETIFSNCIITLNRANVSGGALYADKFLTTGSHAEYSFAANTELIATYMTENSSGGEGGAITNHGKLTFNKDALSYISDNTAVGNGAVIVNTGELLLKSGQLYSNVTTEGRGAIYNSGTIEFTGADLRLNSATVGGAIYNLGTLKFLGGCTYGNKCTVKNAPQIVNLGEMIMQGSFVIEKDIIGLFKNNESNIFTSIQMVSGITTNVKFSVAFYDSLPESGKITECKTVNESGLTAFSGLKRFTQTAAERCTVFNDGFGSYRVDDNGNLSFVFPVMPLFAWILCVVGVAGITCGAVIFIRKKKSSKPETKPEKSE